MPADPLRLVTGFSAQAELGGAPPGQRGGFAGVLFHHEGQRARTISAPHGRGPSSGARKRGVEGVEGVEGAADNPTQSQENRPPASPEQSRAEQRLRNTLSSLLGQKYVRC